MLSLRFFSTFEVSIDNEPITNFRSTKVQGLLVYLAMSASQPHRREAVATLLWPEAQEHVAKKNLRQSLYQLRKVLGDIHGRSLPHLLVTRQTVQFNQASDYSLDVQQFLEAIDEGAWERAVSHFTGDLLPSFPYDSLEFEDWLRYEREHLHQLALKTMMALTDKQLKQHAYGAAQATARQQLMFEPWREVAHQQLMQAMALSGDQRGAIAQFDICRHVLRKELAVEPSNATQTLYQRIVAGEYRVWGAETAVLHAMPLLLPTDVIPPPAPLPPQSVMPLRKNPLFVGREDDLRALAAMFNAEQMLSISQVETAVTTGLGGIGKTQLASEFVHRYGQFFKGGVYWLRFENGEAIPAEVAACGDVGAMELRADFGRRSLPEQVKLVQTAWQSPVPRLLVFDNCEDPNLLAKWRPTSGGCRVLLTSRRGDWEVALGVQMLPLGVLSRAESLALLRQHRSDLDDDFLDAIAEELGDLPLALHLAGCHLRRYQRSVTPADYLRQLQDPLLLHHPSMQGEGISPTGHVQHVGRTFALSYDRLDPKRERDVLALTLLTHAAHFAPGEPIWYTLLVKTLGLQEEEAVAAFKVEQAFARLIELGLIETEQDEARPSSHEILRMHRLIAKFVRDVAHESVEATEKRVEEIVFAETAQINEAGYPMPLLAWQLHLRSVVDVAQAREDEQGARLCQELGEHLWQIGDYDGALPYMRKALAIRKKVLGATHLETAESLNHLGDLYRTMGAADEARSCFEQAIVIQRQQLQPESAALAKSLNHLGLWHMAYGEATTAKTYFLQALAIGRNVLGEMHPITAEYENNVGDSLRRLDALAASLPYLRRALAINEKVYGLMHTNTAMNLNNIAITLHDMGALLEAQPYYEEALAIRREVIGREHSETALILNNLGRLLRDLGEFAQSYRCLAEALAIFEEVFPEAHPYTAFCLNNLGLLLHKQGKLREAQAHLERALMIRQLVLAEDHPLIATSLRNLEAVQEALARLAADAGTATDSAA